MKLCIIFSLMFTYILTNLLKADSHVEYLLTLVQSGSNSFFVATEEASFQTDKIEMKIWLQCLSVWLNSCWSNFMFKFIEIDI